MNKPKIRVTYTLQVRCHFPRGPFFWEDWEEKEWIPLNEREARILRRMLAREMGLRCESVRIVRRTTTVVDEVLR